MAIPTPKTPKAGKTSKFAGKTLIANPMLNGANPRQAGSHGFTLHEIIRQAGSAGIRYEELRKRASALIDEGELIGFSNHIDWDMKRNFILIKEDYPELYKK
jgi:hypothetical protein